MTGRDRDPNVILDPFITTAVSRRDKFFFSRVNANKAISCGAVG